MLNGIDPILIFQFKKLIPDVDAALAKFSLSSAISNFVEYPPVPVYLSEKLTGIYIQSEAKNLDIQTRTDTVADGDSPIFTQKGVGSTVTINMVASRASLGLSIIIAMTDLIFAKLTSKEYSITYVHGGITVFGGLLHSFSVNQSAENDLYEITMELSRGGSPAQVAPKPDPVQGGATLDAGGQLTGGTLPPNASGAQAPFTTQQAGSASVARP